MKKIVLGITGGIATGKTTVTAMFAELGTETISADEIAREVLAPGTEASEEAINRFGPSILSSDGSIDRRALGEIVFRDPDALQSLNAITHPHIIAALKDRIQRFRESPKGPHVLAAEIPLLVECNLIDLVDKVVVVSAEQETQIHRLTTRGLFISEALQRISAQVPIDEKLALADWVIRTDGSLEDTRRQVQWVWEQVEMLSKDSID
jgi:dephospho-CoA kinase